MQLKHRRTACCSKHHAQHLNSGNASKRGPCSVGEGSDVMHMRQRQVMEAGCCINSLRLSFAVVAQGLWKGQGWDLCSCYQVPLHKQCHCSVSSRLSQFSQQEVFPCVGHMQGLGRNWN